MSRDNIILLIEHILNNELELNVKDLYLDKTLLSLGIDSISFMTLIVYLEDKLSIEIELIDGLSDEYTKITLDTLVGIIFGKVENL